MAVEIARETGLPAISVVKNLLSPDSIATPVGVDGKNPQKWLQEVQTPCPSKKADKIRSTIWAEGQRYQRRPQFPTSTQSRTTRKKAESGIVNQQLGKIRLKVGFPREQDLDEREETKIRIQKRWRDKTSSPEIVWTRDRKEAEKKAARLLEILTSLSVVPLERPGRIKEILTTAAFSQEPAIVLNWVCPPGTPLQVAPDGSGLYRSYLGVDFQLGLEKDYRLIPRLDLERRLIKAFERTEIPLWYIKLVADNNPCCLYPYSLVKDGRQPTMEAISQYAQVVQARLDQEIGPDKITVLTVSEFLGPERFQRLVDLFFSTPTEALLPFLPPEVVEIEKDVLTKHTKLKPELMPYLEAFAVAVIRQYGAEGDQIWDMLDDQVIVAWNESTRRASTIDSIRKAKGRPSFPKVFALHRKRDGKIENNF